MKAINLYLTVLAVLLSVITGSVTADDDAGYRSVTGPCNFQFPRDHGAHPGYRTEWWYYTGNVTADSGKPFGFQLTIFRRQISAPDAGLNWPQSSSGWRTQQIYLGHAAVSDLEGRTHVFDESVARGALNLAGVKQSDDITHAFVKDWSIRIDTKQHHLSATSDRFGLDLVLEPLKQPVAHGDRGYSLKGNTPERASCYYSFTRLKTEGRLILDGQAYQVSGLSWMDHEYSTAPLQPGIIGWDWFSLQLSGNRELMMFLLRMENGKINQASSGTLVLADTQRHLTSRDFSVISRDEWRSPESGAVYPQRWQIDIPSESISLELRSPFPEQEMRTESSTGVTYWEGSVVANGTIKHEPLNGRGYIEMTGYSKVFDKQL